MRWTRISWARIHRSQRPAVVTCGTTFWNTAFGAHPERGSSDLADGSDYYHVVATYTEALAFSRSTEGAEAPLALVRPLEHIDEPTPGDYRHVKEVRITEWPVEFLRRPRRTPNTIPDFLSPNAPANRLDILRGLTKEDGASLN